MRFIPFDDYQQYKLNQMLELNIETSVALIREVSKGIIQNNYARIVNNASVAGQIGYFDVWYDITKAGIIHPTKSVDKTE